MIPDLVPYRFRWFPAPEADDQLFKGLSRVPKRTCRQVHFPRCGFFHLLEAGIRY